MLRASEELNLDLSSSYFIGDAVSDVEAALAAGCSPIFVLTGRGQEQRTLLQPRRHAHVPVAQDLAEAVTMILAGEGPARPA